MPPCHTHPFRRRGLIVDRTKDAANRERSAAIDLKLAAECCDYCRAATLEWRKCKLVCATCRQINKSCADL